MKNFKLIIIALLLSFGVNAQTKTFNSKIKIKDTPAAAVSDTLMAIQPDGLIVKSNLSISDALKGGIFEAVDQGKGIGFILKGRDTLGHKPVGLGAFDVSVSSSTQNDKGADGSYSIAFGQDNIARGWSFVAGLDNVSGGFFATVSGRENSGNSYSAIFGEQNKLSGTYSISGGLGNTSTSAATHTALFGWYNKASGARSFAANESNETRGASSAAFGTKNVTQYESEFLVGDYGTIAPTPQTGTNRHVNRRVFNVGIGEHLINNVGEGRRDGFTVNYDGSVLAPNLTNELIASSDSTVLITKKYFETNSSPAPEASAAPTGLEAVVENNKTGYRIVGRDATRYADVGTFSVDLGFAVSGSSDGGASGSYSVVSGGENNKALNSYGVVSGGRTNFANSSYATIAGGNSQTVQGLYGTVSGGGFNRAGGTYSTSAGGVYNNAASYGEWVGGIFSTEPSGHSASTYKLTDRIFNVGNGTATTARSDAFTVLKNGLATLPSVTTALIAAADSTAVITKGYLEANAGSSSGLEAIDEGNGIGFRLIGRDPSFYGNIIENAIDFSYQSSPGEKGAVGYGAVATGFDSTASGQFSSALGSFGANATGSYSTIIGSVFISTASGQGSGIYSSSRANNAGDYSVILGGDENTIVAAADKSVILGGDSNLSNNIRQVVSGIGNIANNIDEMVVGEYSTIIPTTTASDRRLFNIGNGSNSGSRSDALTVRSNGLVEAPSLTSQLITDNGDQTLITKGYFNNNTSSGGTLELTSYTVATLPASVQEGTIAYVTDGLSPTYRSNITGGGTERVLVFFDGSNWISN